MKFFDRLGIWFIAAGLSLLAIGVARRKGISHSEVMKLMAQAIRRKI